MNREYTCCFFGHRKINETPALIKKVTETTIELIENCKVTTFLFGSKSDFDSLCLKVVSDLKERYPYIKRVYVRAAYPDISESYTDYLLESYEETYYPERLRNSGKASYVERNQEMIDKSDFCIVYYDESYKPPRRKNSRRDLFDYQPKSGTALALNYAKQRKKNIIYANIMKSFD